MEEVIIRIDSETIGADGPDKQLLGKLSILNYLKSSGISN